MEHTGRVRVVRAVMKLCNYTCREETGKLKVQFRFIDGNYQKDPQTGRIWLGLLWRFWD